MTWQYIQPPFLKKGDEVVILAPAGKVVSTDIDHAATVLQQWGLRPYLGKNLHQHLGSLAGSDQQRRQDLQEALDSTTFRAIFCARGGYGTTRIVDSLDFTLFRKYPKWLIGFSDITALHLALHQQQIQSIHAIMPIQFAKKDYQESLEQLRKVLFGEQLQWCYRLPTDNYSKKGTAVAPLIGGNLSLLVNQLATSTMPNVENKILFLEETGERLYHIDRMMTQLKRAGVLDDIVGLALGHFSINPNPDNEFHLSFQEIILEKIMRPYPVAFGFPFGHQAPNYPLVCGAKAILEVNSTVASLSMFLHESLI
ncbi:MAG: LD-carboxypeptidase [Flammeovirgaceae bacterium]|nr:LD-carboxypeptidase [Flammeovirgaceae bacterium]MDW8287900.1 LD-carboxypeptidase [Flammeovirgaceae bacterium]